MASILKQRTWVYLIPPILGLIVIQGHCCCSNRWALHDVVPTTTTSSRSEKLTVSGFLDVNTTHVVHITNEKFLSVAIDANVIRAGWIHFDFASATLKNLARALSPTYLRMGGTDADFLLFCETETTNRSDYQESCHHNNNYKKHNMPDYRTNFTMSARDWDNINQFAVDVGWEIIFDLNMLLRNCSTWDSTNAQELLGYTKKKGYRIAGWELGNEPNHIQHHSNITITAKQLGQDFIALRTMLDKNGFEESFLVGPDITRPQLLKQSATEFLKSFLQVCDNSTYATTWHSYFVNVRNTTVDNFIDPYLMDSLRTEIYQVQQLIQKYRPHLPKSWLGETAGISGGGAPGLSNAYAGGFLWLDKLGLSALYGVDLVIRQSFYGDYYSLLDEDLNPTTCYWLSLLYKQLVGHKVLNATVKVEDDSEGSSYLTNPPHIRVYAHCTNNLTSLGSPRVNGSITLFVLNLQKTNYVTFTLSGELTHKTVFQYLLVPHGEKTITATKVDLNGKELKLTDSGTLPVMDEKQLDMGEPITVPPLTFGFYVINTNASACL